MLYVDVVFPLNLGRLTYRCPEGLSDTIRPGMLVSAPLRKGSDKGIVIDIHETPRPGRLREISEIHGDRPVVGRDMLKLITWMADYYIAPEGIILKQTIPQEIFDKTRERKSSKEKASHQSPGLPDLPHEELTPILKASGAGKYQSFLVHAPSTEYEYSIGRAIIMSGMKRALFILPETIHADRFFEAVEDIAPDRSCILHSGIARGRRSTAVDGIIAGKYDLVIGTRAALFSPLQDVSLIMVMHEHSGSYKLEDGVRYNIRDAAVMRAFMAKAAVVLSSVSPSADSWFNALCGKYRLIRPAAEPARPRIRIIDMRYERKTSPHVAKPVFEAARRNLRDGKQTIFVMNRRGYASLLLCKECGYTESCDACSLPMVLYKEDQALRCHRCGTARPVTDRCSRCRGFSLEPVGAGTQRIQEELSGLFGVDALRFDSDRVKRESETGELLKAVSGGSKQLVIGTKMLTRRLGGGRRFSAAVILNMDTSLNQPDFRAAEKAYMELSSLAGLIGPAGEVFIQTRFPSTSLYRCFRENDYASFVREELAQRQALKYPPYVRLLNLTVSGEPSLPDRIIKHILKMDGDIEVLGPLSRRNKKGVEEFDILLKSSNRKALNTAARDVMERFGNSRGVTITADVDPL